MLIPHNPEVGATATATEMQNNFGRYLNLVMNGSEVIVTKNGREVGRFIPKGAAVSYLTDSLTGILQGNYRSMLYTHSNNVSARTILMIR